MTMKICIILIWCFIANSLYSQIDFKEVKTAQNVFDNYISATGGADKLEKINSETITGTIKVQNFEGSFITYKDDSMLVSSANGKLEGKDMLMLMSVTTRNYAWEYQMGAMKDFTGEELQNKEENRILGSLGFYFNYKNNGYNAELKGVENVNGKDCYKVLITKSGKELKTSFFDTKTFYILRSEKPDGPVLEFSDFKEVKGVIRPFKIILNTHAKIDQFVNEYRFNEPVDQALLVKPTNE